jgi:hypothetical protein
VAIIEENVMAGSEENGGGENENPGNRISARHGRFARSMRTRNVAALSMSAKMKASGVSAWRRRSNQ